MDPALLSLELRRDGDPMLARRRGIAVLALVAGGCMAYITLYQMGVVRRLREPPLPRLDADRVDASAEAYRRYRGPDAAIGLLSYAATAVSATTGPRDRTPWLSLAMLAKVTVDALQAAKLSRDQWTRHRAFCSWCLTAAAATFAMLPLAVPEAVSGVRRLLRR